jgi:preprotein translocase subunit SecD
MLALLAGIIVVMILAIVGADLASPGKWSSNFRVHLGLDLTSGTTVALQAVKPGGGTPESAEMQQAIQIMNNRVNGAGFTEAQVEQQGSDVITVSVPGQSAQTVVSQVSRTAELQFPPGAAGRAERAAGPRRPPPRRRRPPRALPPPARPARHRPPPALPPRPHAPHPRPRRARPPRPGSRPAATPPWSARQ